MLLLEIDNPTPIPLSLEQRASYDLSLNRENVALDSCAGSGKTHTASAITINCKRPVQHVPYGRSLSDSMIDRFKGYPHVSVLNAHRRGIRLCGNVEIDDRKVHKICAELDEENGGRLAEFVKMLKTEAYGLPIDHLSAEAIAEKYGFKEEMIDDALVALMKSDEQRNVVDFEDMLRFPVLDGRFTTDPDALYVFDEVQDYTPLIWCFVRECLTTPDSHVFMVGDPSRQCLMMFAGADPSIFDTMAEHYGCHRLQLTENRRCAKAIVANAPHSGNMVALPDAPEGEVTSIPESAFLAEVKEGKHSKAAIISEANSPLIALGVSLLTDGVPCQMREEKIEKTILRFCYPYLDTRSTRIGQIADKVDKDIAEIEADGGDVALARDVAKCIRALETYCLSKGWTRPTWIRRKGKRPLPVNPIQNALRELVNGKEGITLMTGHTSKGLEWDEVFHLPANTKEPDHDWQIRQNECLAHVIATRAKTYFATLGAS